MEKLKHFSFSLFSKTKLNIASRIICSWFLEAHYFRNMIHGKERLLSYRMSVSVAKFSDNLDTASFYLGFLKYICISQSSPEKESIGCIYRSKEIYYKNWLTLSMETGKSKSAMKASRQRSRKRDDVTKSKGSLLKKYLLVSRGLVFFVLFWPSTNWTRPTHTMGNNLLYSTN